MLILGVFGTTETLVLFVNVNGDSPVFLTRRPKSMSYVPVVLLDEAVMIMEHLYW
jgi:hypothetical protein